MEKIKFVMTDTGAQVSALCRQALENKGVAVTVCEKNGNKALETLLDVHPQAVLLDAFMPDLDAITVKQRYEAQNTSGTRTTFFVTGALLFTHHIGQAIEFVAVTDSVFVFMGVTERLRQSLVLPMKR